MRDDTKTTAAAKHHRLILVALGVSIVIILAVGIASQQHIAYAKTKHGGDCTPFTGVCNQGDIKPKICILSKCDTIQLGQQQPQPPANIAPSSPDSSGGGSTSVDNTQLSPPDNSGSSTTDNSASGTDNSAPSSDSSGGGGSSDNGGSSDSGGSSSDSGGSDSGGGSSDSGGGGSSPY